MTDEVQVKDGSKTPLTWYKQLWAIKNTLIVILTPLILLPLPIAWPVKVCCFFNVISFSIICRLIFFLFISDYNWSEIQACSHMFLIVCFRILIGRLE